MPSTLNLLPFQICLLGSFEIKKISALSETSTVALAYDKGRALLTYLACHPGVEQNRGKLAELLWPDFSRDAALTNLRMVLHDLRAKLNPDPHAAPCLFIDRSSIQFNPVYANRVDVHLFSSAFPLNPHNAEKNLTTDHVQLEKLVAAYRGNFMESFSVQGCDAFEEWLQVKRETFLRRTLSALERLANKYQAIAQFDKALEYAHRFCELEPWNEDGHRRVMRLYSANGQPSTALSHFDSCVRMLKSELGVTPSPQTQLLAEQIRLGLSSEVAQETKAFRTFERKQVTTVYCEILATDHEEPEDRLASLLEPRRICLAIFQRYSGYVIQKHGSGLLAYFGFPLAHEQAAKLAVGAALEIAQLELPDCQFKLGIHTGMIIVGDDESIPDSIGATSELAIRLRLIAEPGEIII
ncbi:MAG: hypothetical protein KGM99_20630, partial [Burkholderiales bacterium]|nr:hypothetical protein [Burkholderiales bacterium]